MKVLMRIFLMSLLTSMSYASDKGNGGGGIVRGERYMTFHTAGFHINPIESDLEEVPELNNLVKFFDDHSLIPDRLKMIYIGSLLPSSSRKYFKVKEDRFTDEVRDSLLAEFSRVAGADLNELTLFAITDTNSRSTYLLPNFFKLSSNDQKAILFHEAYWILNPEASYEQVVEAEMSFQAHLEKPTSSKKLTSFIGNVGSSSDFLKMLVSYDLKMKTLDGLLIDNKILTNELIGQDFIDCRKKLTSNHCYELMSLNIYKLTKLYPDSLLLSYFFEKSYERKLTISFRHYISSYAHIEEVDTVSLPYLRREKCSFFSKDDSIDLVDSLDPIQPIFLDVVGTTRDRADFEVREYCGQNLYIID